MNKTDLAEAVADKADISKDKASEVVNAITDEITAALARDEQVTLIGFGSFVDKELFPYISLISEDNCQQVTKNCPPPYRSVPAWTTTC